VLVALLLATTAWLGWAFKPVPLLAVLVIVVHFGLLRLFTRYDSGDRGALAFLEKVWLAPKGVTVHLFAP
jgi:hypothetical protein